MDCSCWPCMVDPIWLSVPLASPPMMHGLLLLTEHAMALQLLCLFMSCFLSLECPYPPCPQHKLLLVLHGPDISSSDAFPTLLHSELPPPALCTRPAWFLPPWVAPVYPPDWKSLKTETSPLVAWYPQNLNRASRRESLQATQKTRGKTGGCVAYVSHSSQKTLPHRSPVSCPSSVLASIGIKLILVLSVVTRIS